MDTLGYSVKGDSQEPTTCYFFAFLIINEFLYLKQQLFHTNIWKKWRNMLNKMTNGLPETSSFLQSENFWLSKKLIIIDMVLHFYTNMV